MITPVVVYAVWWLVTLLVVHDPVRRVLAMLAPVAVLGAFALVRRAPAVQPVLQGLPSFTATELISLIIGLGGLFSAFLTYRSSARASDVDLVKATMSEQRALITSLQAELNQERLHSGTLEQRIVQLEQENKQLKDRVPQRGRQ